MNKAFRFRFKRLFAFLLAVVRQIQIEFNIMFAGLNKRNSPTLRLFNVDLHTSIIADLKEGLKAFDIDLISWSASGNNRNFRKFFRIKDPIVGLSEKNWFEYESSDFEKFRKRYRRYLNTFDGFIVCFPPAFLDLFIDTGKPILLVIGTRYESPYTSRPDKWNDLNQKLKDGYSSNQLIVAVNNRADRNYLEHFTGIKAKYVPSLCDYTQQRWEGNSNKKLLLSKNLALRNRIQAESCHVWETPAEAYGSPYSWAELHQVQEILVLPYNISTMTLFELATSGVPVSVPSKSMIKLLRNDDKKILSELSFFQVRELTTCNLAEEDPNNTGNEKILDWWLDQADFYDKDLMPNVRVIDSFADLATPHPFNLEESKEALYSMLNVRNSRIRSMRHSLLSEFIKNVNTFKMVSANNKSVRLKSTY